MVDQLERAGFVKRLRSTDDRRMVIVSLTEEGAKLHDGAAGAQHEVVCKIGMDDEAFAQLRSELHALVERMEAQDALLPADVD